MPRLPAAALRPTEQKPAVAPAPALAANVASNLDRTAQWGPLVRTRTQLDIHFHPQTNAAPFAAGYPLLGVAYGILISGLHPQPALHAASFLVALWGLAYAIAPGTRRKWRMHRLPACTTSDPTDGAVRIVGTLEPQGDVFAGLGGGNSLLYARTFFRRVRADGTADLFIREEIRGAPFILRRADGAAFRIDPGSAWVQDGATELTRVSQDDRRALGAPTRGIRQQIRQVTLSPGDVVEAVGRVAHEISPDGVAVPGRGTPIVQKLVPIWEDGVWIRRLGRAAAQPPLPRSF
jgi:hypothetical protein